MKSALEERMKCEVPSRHPILAFLVEHAGRLSLRYQVDRDGRTAYELHAGKLYRRQLVEFGKRVHFMPIRPGGARQAKLDLKWQDGAFVGIRDRSGEMLIMTPSGVHKTRNVRRRPESERRDSEFFTTFEGYAVEPNSGGGRDGSRCTSRRDGSPDASTCTSPSSRGGSGTGGPKSEQIVHPESRCAEIRLQHELSWIQISDDEHDSTCAY